MSQYLVWLAKIGVSCAILGCLSYQAWQDRSFDELVSQPKHWGLLVAALAAHSIALLLGIFRWYLLVRALELPFAFRDASRLSLIGQFFNFLALGAIGGDVLKALFIAREHHGRRTEAVASVIVDRVIGLYSLFLMATAAILWNDVSQPQVLRVCQATVGLTILGAGGFGILLLPGFTQARFWTRFAVIPSVGGWVDRVLCTVRAYRGKRAVLAVSLLLSLGSTACSIVGVYLVARGLPGLSPSLGTHFVIVPIALVANVVPLPGGLGAFEAALDLLYRGVAVAGSASGRGFVIALALRLMALLFALVGAGYYVIGRRQVTTLVQAAQE